MTPEQQALANAVAAELNLAPAPGFDGHWARVFDLPDGGRLFFQAARDRGQLHISASVAERLREHRPYYRQGEAPETSINVSISKGARRIAADVRRRLLAEYEREAAACAANKARSDDINAKRVAALTQVAAPFGERVQCDERSGEPRPLSIDREGKFSLTAKPYCEAVKLEIEVSPDVAGRIAVLLAAL
ncbi:MAG: hypothetical protein NT154_23910 [Verrucomicrobia bacterium]|nr:hypothetical protein [Verrucomicrobiota bacterium]